MNVAQVMFQFGETQHAGIGIIIGVIAVAVILGLLAKKK